MPNSKKSLIRSILSGLESDLISGFYCNKFAAPLATPSFGTFNLLKYLLVWQKFNFSPSTLLVTGQHESQPFSKLHLATKVRNSNKFNSGSKYLSRVSSDSDERCKATVFVLPTRRESSWTTGQVKSGKTLSRRTITRAPHTYAVYVRDRHFNV